MRVCIWRKCLKQDEPGRDAALTESGITDVFMVTGGGAMHLDDGLGHEPGLHCIFNHHEQACAIAAECYARIHNKIAAVCVTTGPGGTNAITGVVGGWLDSIPMLILSGQVRYDTTARSTGLGIRAMGDQEFDIVKAVDCMTKYSEMVLDPMRIRFCLEKALYLAQSGRPGQDRPVPESRHWRTASTGLCRFASVWKRHCILPSPAVPAPAGLTSR